MSNSDFVKGACRHCAGHLEFPSTAIGQTVSCPHCGQSTELTASETGSARASRAAVDAPSTVHCAPPRKGSRSVMVVMIMVFCLCAVAAAAFLIIKKSHQSAVSDGKTAAGQTNAPLVAHTASAGPQPEAQTNDFAIMPFKLEKTAGSSLVYVTGTVRNLSDHQRFGVKLSFGLFDTNNSPVGSATDYQQVIDPHAVWKFKALVMASKTTSAQFNSIAEDQ